MLRSREEMRCGIFDSRVQRKNKAKSVLRTVTDYELELFLEDGGTSHINGEAFAVKRGMLLCARPGDKRYSDFPVRCSFLRLQPRSVPDACQRVLEGLPRCFYPLRENAAEVLFPLFSKLEGGLIVHGEEGDAELLRSNSLLFEILCRVKTFHGGIFSEEKRPSLDAAVSEAYEYINEHYRESCRLEDIAKAVHLTPNYLHTVFTHQLGKTPFSYRNEKRMAAARRLLAAGEKSMIQIALETGFCSQSHFNRVFKENCGLTPAQYRKKMLFDY